MASRPTIVDVARAAGVSKSLVSFALNDRPGVSAETRTRILEVADSIGFRPSVPARALTNRRAYSVGLVIARDLELVAADPFYPPFIAGAERALTAAGYTITLSILDSERDEADVYRSLARDARVDGVLLGDLRPDDPRLDLLAELELPAVTLGRTGDGRFPAVIVDDVAGIEATVAHLLALGHRRLALVGGPRSLVHGRRRADAFRRAAGPDAVVLETDFTPAAAAAATRTLLDAPAPPTAIVYGNDVAAAAGISVALGRGLTIPRDLSVCGFDDAEIAQWTHPALTTVSTSPGRWGESAASALLALLGGRRPLDTDLGAARLVVRSSSGPAPTGPDSASVRRSTP